MATVADIMKLLKAQSEADKEERTRERELERNENKEVIEKFIAEVKEVKTDIKEIKTTQTKSDENYSCLAEKLRTLEIQMKDLQKKETVQSPIQSGTRGSVPPFSQIDSALTIHPPGKTVLSPQPSQSEQSKIYSIVKEAKKTLGFSPISENDIKTVMEENNITDRKEGLVATIKDFLLLEMGMPLEESNQLKMNKIFRPHEATDSQSEKIFVEFQEDNMPGVIFKYVRKMNKNSSIHIYIPPAFQARAADLEKCAYNLRHSEPTYNTKIRWGACDLLLERKLKSNPSERYRDVTVQGLPPVDLNPPPPIARRPLPSSSPAPGRRERSKRNRSITPTHSSPNPKTSRQEDPAQPANLQNRGVFLIDNFRSPAQTSVSEPSPVFRRAGSANRTPLDFQ